MTALTSVMFVRFCAVLASVLPAVALAQQSGTGEAPLPALEESVWPPLLPPLRVLIRPKPEEPGNTVPAPPGDEAAILLLDGRHASLLGFLTRRREHDTDWRMDEDLAAASVTLRPEISGSATMTALVERADLALMMGGAMLGMTPAQIYVHYGFLEDGTKPRSSGYGVISPIDPVSCPEGGVSCRQTILKN